MKKLLITGAGPRGFLGKAVKNALSDEYDIYAPSRETLDLLDGDAVAAWMRAHPVDAIVHSAFIPARPGVDKDAENDLRMFFNLECCRNDYGRLIHFGSGAEFDKRFPMENVKEEDFGKTIPVNAYGFAKYVINQYTRASAKVTNLRLFGIFGPEENWRVKFITGLCYKAVFGLPLTVRQHCMFDFMDIDDLLPVVRAAIEGKLGQRDYNVCSGRAVDIFEIAQMVRNYSPRKVSLELLNDRWDKPYTASNARLQNEIGMQIMPLEQAVQKTLAHFEAVKNPQDLEALRTIR